MPSATRSLPFARATGAQVLVTGTTALNIDVTSRLSSALPPFLALVIGLSFLLLMVAFCSLFAEG
jgi:RND superfamily putative drug exporter